MKPSSNTDDLDSIIQKCLLALGDRETHSAIRQQTNRSETLNHFINETIEQGESFDVVTKENPSLCEIQIIQKDGELKTFITNAVLSGLADYFKVYQRTGKTEPLVKRLVDAIQLFNKAGKQIAQLETTLGNTGNIKADKLELHLLQQAQQYTATLSSLFEHIVEMLLKENKKER